MTAARESGSDLGHPLRVAGLVMVGLCCLLIAACNGAFHFAGADAALAADASTETDARVDADADPPPVDSGAVDDGRSAADGSPCDVTCAPGRTCVMSASEGCTATCKNATCQITLGESGKAVCTDGAACTISCAEECSVTCLDTSRCATQCNGATLSMPVATSLVCGQAD